VSRSLKALVLEAPFFFFLSEQAPLGMSFLSVMWMGCGSTRRPAPDGVGCRRWFETGVLLYRCIGWALNPALSR
jgi:hypothetical protein